MDNPDEAAQKLAEFHELLLTMNQEGEQMNCPSVQCGLFKGKLLLDRFHCPGINRQCIMFEGRLLTPKQFTILAGKEAQKDWKSSIYLEGRKIRRLMSLKLLDFTDHAQQCSSRCQSQRAKSVRKHNFDLFETLPPHLEQIDTKPPLPPSSPPANLSSHSEWSLKALMAADPVRFFTDLHHREILPQVVQILANVLASTQCDDPLPTAFIASFAPALAQAVSTFSMESDVFSLIRQKSDLHLASGPCLPSLIKDEPTDE